jgi:hypothetical protein
MVPSKIAESDTQLLDHGLCESGVSIYNEDTIQNTLSAWNHYDRSINESQDGLKKLKPQVSQKHPPMVCFITPGWHITCDIKLLSLKMVEWTNSNVSSNKCVFVKIVALKPNQI